MSIVTTEQIFDGAVLRVVLNRPKANILDAAMIAAIGAALDSEVQAQTALIVFDGEGKHFSFGASVEEHQADQAAGMLAAFHGLFRKLAALSVPTCAVVRGQCLGGGLELASWCSWIVATPDAHLGQPEISMSVYPPMASVLLPWRASGRATLDLCVSGRSLTADEALTAGIVNAVTPEPEVWWRELAQRHLMKTSAAALRFTEQAARRSLMERLEADLPWLERLYLDQLMTTHDANEGIRAFMERRKPEYRHG